MCWSAPNDSTGGAPGSLRPRANPPLSGAAILHPGAAAFGSGGAAPTRKGDGRSGIRTDERDMPAIAWPPAWPSDFPSGWLMPVAEAHDTSPVDGDDLYGWSVIDYEASSSSSAQADCDPNAWAALRD